MTLIGIGYNFLTKRYPRVRVISTFYKDIGKINLNTADKDLLISAQGIGEKLAQRILEYRREFGCFKSIEELKNIKGINDYRYENLKDYFIVE
jgi:competence ComEA-like helix-hairpin-helix protein